MRWIAALLVAVVLSTSACSDSSTATAPAPETTAPAEASITTAPDLDQSPGERAVHAVGRRTIELVDPSRPSAADTARGLPEEPQRTMSVLLLYPTDAQPTDPTTPIDDAAPAAGPFPLVVFSHGLTATGPRYEGRLQEWARAGYVVAAPTYPRSSGPGGQIADYVNQPADVSFVIDELLDLGAGDPLTGSIDGEAIAAAGHSLGAITTLGVTLNSCCADPRIGAAVQISGVRLPFPDGAFDDLGRVPFLAIHGAEDAIVPVSGSDSLFEEADGPAHYLRFPEGDHSGFLVSDGPLVDEVVIGFLDLHLRGDATALEAAADAVTAWGRAVLTEKPGA